MTSLYFNMKVFPMKTALKLPVFVKYNIRCRGLRKGVIKINAPVSTGMIKIGAADGPEGIVTGKEKCSIILGQSGQIIFDGTANLSNGTTIRCDGSGIVRFGNKFTCNANCLFASNTEIVFGEDCMLGWNVSVRDSDGHKLFNLDQPGVRANNDVGINIGDHVWLSSYSDVLKGAKVSNNSVIGYRACVTKRFEESNCVIAGIPGKIVKHGVTWER